MQAYSVEFRGDVLAACDAHQSPGAIARRFQVSPAWVRRIQQQRRETGQVAPKTADRQPPQWQAWADQLVTKIGIRRRLRIFGPFRDPK